MDIKYLMYRKLWFKILSIFHVWTFQLDYIEPKWVQEKAKLILSSRLLHMSRLGVIEKILHNIRFLFLLHSAGRNDVLWMVLVKINEWFPDYSLSDLVLSNVL